jgi:hypothetical protein
MLKFITGWLTTPSDGQNILWLYGLAGSGKSTISTTIAEYFRELGRLGAFLFFDRGKPTSSEPSAVIRTLSYKLAYFDPAIKTAISEQIEHSFGITEAATHAQFVKLLKEPLASLHGLHTQGPIVIILDAFDECGDPASRKNLLSLCAQEWGKLPSVFRFLITSRRIPDIEVAISNWPNIMVKELDIVNHANDVDTSLYLHYHMASFRQDPMFQLTSDWPGEEKINNLAQSSAGLFIWAATAVKFIREGHHPDPQLNLLLCSHPREAETALDDLYATALRTAGQWDRDEVAKDFRAVLGVIVLARVPLEDMAIDCILRLDRSHSSCFILSRLRCLLHWSLGQHVQILHASFADYLTDRHRCGSHPWFIDTSVHHQSLAVACFWIMKVELKFNICQLKTSHLSNDDVPGIQAYIQNCIGTHLSYACCFWADHLQETVFEPDILLSLENLLHHQLLYWLEVLSLIKEVPIASSALLSAAHWTSVSVSFYIAE